MDYEKLKPLRQSTNAATRLLLTILSCAMRVCLQRPPSPGAVSLNASYSTFLRECAVSGDFAYSLPRCCGVLHFSGVKIMTNTFNFVERFAPLSSLQGTIVEFNPDKFLIAPENLISVNVQPDHAVVWYKNEGRTLPVSPKWANLLPTGKS